MKHIRVLGALAFLALLALPAAAAHTPLGPGENESLAAATLVEDPTKSWAIYGEIHEGGEAQYFRFAMPQGERIYVQLFIPTDPASLGFVPGLVLMGPGLAAQGTVPEYVEAPADTAAIAVDGVRPARATFEPFSPGAFLELAVIDTPAPESGTYYVAVHAPDRGGRYGIAIGFREAFTVTEWIGTPLALLGIYAWQGESIAFILLPIVATFAVALPLVWRRWTPRRSPTAWAATAAGILFLASGALVLTQLAYAATQADAGLQALVAGTLATISLLLGFFTLRLALRTDGEPDRRTRVRLATYGVIALVAWSGFVVGPAIALVAAVLPAHLPSPRRSEARDEA